MPATIIWWDPNGTTSVGGNGTWTAGGVLWSGTSAQTASLIAWNTADAAGFCAGPSSALQQGVFFVTNNTANLGFAGIFNGSQTPGPCDVTILGTGSLNLASGAQAFSTFNNALGFTRIKVPINGATAIVVPESSGQLFLEGANTYGGGTQLGFSGSPFTGLLNFNNAQSFGTGAITLQTLGNGGALVLEGASALTITNAVNVASITTNNIVGNTAGLTFSGPWTLSGPVQIGSGGGANNIVTISGVISGGFSFGKMTQGSSGILKLTGNNTYTGATTNLSGTLMIDGSGKLGNGSYAGAIFNNSVFDYSSTAAQKLSGIISGTGSFQVDGPGSVTNSAVNTYTGTNLITGGILSIAADTGLGAVPGSATPGSVTLNGGTLQHTTTGSGGTFISGNRGIAIGTAGGTIDIPSATGLPIYTSGQITGPKNPVTKTGAGTLRITTPTSITFSNLTVNGGLWQCAADTIFGAVPATLNPSAITLNGGGISANAGYSLAATRGITIGAAGAQIDCSSTLTIPGPIAGTGNLTKSGANALVLSGANTYSGKTSITNAGVTVSSYNSVVGGVASSSLGAPTTVANGTISIGFGSTTCSNVYVGSGETTDRVLDFAGTTGGVTLEADGTGPLVFSSNPTFSGSGAKTITLVGSGSSGTIQGVIANSAGGATSITKSGTGTWTLSGANTYSGNTTLNTAGQLNFGNQYAIGSGTFVINQNGLFDNTSGGDITVTNAMNLSGGSPTYVGSANNMTISGPVAISTANRTITVNANLLTIVQGITQDVAGRNFAKAGAGTLKLQGANGWSGTTTISGGKLALDGTASLNTSSMVIGATGTFDVSTLASSTYTFGTPLTASGSAVSAANIVGASGGVVDLNNKAISLTFVPATFSGDATHPALIVSQGALSLGGNAFTVNNGAVTALGVGTYVVAQQTTGNITSSGSSTVTVTGAGIAAGTTASISATGNTISLIVQATAAFTGVTASQSITYGTASIALSGVVSGAGPTFPTDGESVAVTIDGNTLPAVIAGGAGAFSLTFNTATIPASVTPYTISYAYAGDASLTAASSTATALTVNKVALTVTATNQSKVYGQTIATGAGSAAFSSSGLQNSETIGSVTLAVSSGGDQANAPISGSPYTISASAATGGSFNANNYTITYVDGSLTVTPASLTVAANGTLLYGNDPSNAVYAVNYATLQGTDTVAVISGSANFSTDATATNYVGTNYIAHIVDVGTLSSPNYTFVAGPDGIMTITNRPLLVTNVLASDKTYDATTAATVDFSGAGLDNFVNGDEASVSLVTTNGTGAFADKNVGIGKTVTVAGLFTTGDLGTNYILIQPTATATISQLASTVGITGNDKTYDGTSNATVNVTFTPLGSDVATPTYTTAAFSDKTAAAGKTVSVSGIALSGADAGNYSVPSTGSTTATINTASLTVSATGINKVYDGTTAATVTLSDNRILGDVVTDNYGSAAFADRNVAAGIAVAVSGISFGGADAANYALANTTASTSADITPRPLTVTALGVNKVYDGTTAATVTLSDNKVLGDAVSDSYTSATFADKNVNTGIAVSVTGISISGADAGNYALGNTTASTTANITIGGLTVSGVVVLDKVYDGTTNATVILTNAALVGVSGSDDVTLVTSNAVAAFTGKNADTNKVVNVTGLSIVGADAGNYSLVQPSTNANITPASLTVSATGINKVYDSTTAATVTLSDDKIAGDTVTDAYASAAFADRNVNTGIAVSVSGISISGADAANYTLANTTASATADITLRSLTVTATGVNKVYEGTPVATVNLSDDKVSGDAVSDSYTAAVFSDKNVGTAKAVSVTGISISGADSANYSLANTSTATVADITPRPLTVSALAANKVYDGTTTASVTLSDDKVLGDDVSETNTAANFADANVGTGKTVTVTGISISGADTNNYALVSTTATTTANITALASSAAIVSSQNPSIETSNVTFTATISAGVGTPAGNVVFLANGTPFSTNSLVAGVASAGNAGLPVGTNLISAQYAAQGNYLGSSDSLNQIVNSGVTLSVTNMILSIVNNGDGTYDVEVQGTPDAVYYLQTSSDLTVPAMSWAVVPGSTNTADSIDGKWSATVSNPPPAYFRSTAVNPAP